MSFTAPRMRATTPTLVMVPAIQPRILWAMLLVGVGVGFIALLAQVRIPIPGSPVPLTGQTLGVLLIGAAYGSRLGSLTVLSYLAVGIAGLPVFTNGNAGWTYFTGATGGYLVGFLLAAMLVGVLAERGWDRVPWLAVAAMVLGNAIIYACGVTWLQHVVNVDWGRAWALGARPFLVMDAVKIVIAAGLLPAAWWLKERGL